MAVFSTVIVDYLVKRLQKVSTEGQKSGAPGRIRTCDPRIRSPKTYVLACLRVSGNWAYLCDLRRFLCSRISVLFGSVLAWLQYGCSKWQCPQVTLLLEDRVAKGTSYPHNRTCSGVASCRLISTAERIPSVLTSALKSMVASPVDIPFGALTTRCITLAPCNLMPLGSS